VAGGPQRATPRRQQHEIEAAAPRQLLERLIGALDQQQELGVPGRGPESLASPAEILCH
jgi:hypothetical protein